MNAVDLEDEGPAAPRNPEGVEWHKPELVKLRAEWAELGDLANPDAAINS